MVDFFEQVADTDSICITKDALRMIINVLPSGNTSNLDTSYKLAMIVIGACNLIFTFFLFYHNKKTAKKKTDDDRRKSILYDLVLNYKMDTFYKSFANLEKESRILVENNDTCMEDKKIELDDKYQDWFSYFRMNFTESLGAIDNKLYHEIMKHADNLQGTLSKNLFDEGVNLNIKRKYEELIVTPILNTQKDMLAVINSYI